MKMNMYVAYISLLIFTSQFLQTAESLVNVLQAHNNFESIVKNASSIFQRVIDRIKKEDDILLSEAITKKSLDKGISFLKDNMDQLLWDIKAIVGVPPGDPLRAAYSRFSKSEIVAIQNELAQYLIFWIDLVKLLTQGETVEGLGKLNDLFVYQRKWLINQDFLLIYLVEDQWSNAQLFILRRVLDVSLQNIMKKEWDLAFKKIKPEEFHEEFTSSVSSLFRALLPPLKGKHVTISSFSLNPEDRIELDKDLYEYFDKLHVILKGKSESTVYSKEFYRAFWRSNLKLFGDNNLFEYIGPLFQLGRYS